MKEERGSGEREWRERRVRWKGEMEGRQRLSLQTNGQGLLSGGSCTKFDAICEGFRLRMSECWYLELVFGQN
jgi:hypothetical protein